MAELVGDAYVRIHADSTGMERAIQRQINDAAERAGTSFVETFDESVRRHADTRLRTINEAFTRAIASGNWDDAFDGARTSIDRFTTLARRRIISINEELIQMNGEGMEDFQSRLDDLDRWARGRALERAFQRMGIETRELGDGIDENDRLFRRFGNTLNRTVVLMRRDNDLIGRMFGMGSRSEILNFFGRTIAFFTRLPQIGVAAMERVVKGIANIIDTFHDLRAAGLSLPQTFGLMAGSLLRTVIPAVAALISAGLVIGKILPVIMLLVLDLAGAVLALGSALLVGLVGALTVVLGMIPALIAGISFIVIGMGRWGDGTDAMKKKLKPLTQAWAELQQRVGDEFLGQVAKNADGLAKVLKDVLKPMLFDIGDAFGKVLKQFTDLFNSKQMKPFLDALRVSIPRVLEDLGTAFVRAGGAITAMLKPLLPIVERLAQKIADAALEWLNWATSPQGQKDLQQWFEDLYQSAKDLWRLLGSIGKVLGTVIKAATGVGSGGQGVGSDWISTMATNLEKFDKWLNEPISGDKEWDPLTRTFTVTNKTRIQKWFDDVADTVGNLSTAISNLATELGKIDWDKARRDLEKFLEILGQVTGAIGTVIAFFNTMWTNMETFGQNILDALPRPEEVVEAMEGFGQSILDALPRPEELDFGKWILEQLPRPEQVVEAMEGVGQAILDALPRPEELDFGRWILDHLPRPEDIVEGMEGVGQAILDALPRPEELDFGKIILEKLPRPEEVGAALAKIPGAIATALAQVAFSMLTPFITTWALLSSMISTWPGLVAGIIGRIPGAVFGALRTLASNFVLPFTLAWLGLTAIISMWPSLIGGIIGRIPGAIRGALVGVAGIIAAPFVSAYALVKGALESIATLIRNFRFPTPSFPKFSLPSWLPGDQTAAGGVFYGPTTRLIGEAGPEAVVPLNRDLALVDPAVRALSAYAQGKTASGPGPQIVFSAGSIVVNSPSASPAIVAEAVVDRIAARILV